MTIALNTQVFHNLIRKRKPRQGTKTRAPQARTEYLCLIRKRKPRQGTKTVITPFIYYQIVVNIRKRKPRQGTKTLHAYNVQSRFPHQKTNTPIGDENSRLLVVSVSIVILENEYPDRGRKRRIGIYPRIFYSNWKTNTPIGDENSWSFSLLSC